MASTSCARQGEGGREERRRGGEWSGAGEVRHARRAAPTK